MYICNLKRLCIIFQAFWECFVHWWTDVADKNLTLTLQVVISGPGTGVLPYLGYIGMCET